MLDTVSLSNPDAELALVGSLLAWPDAMRSHAAAVEADWFTQGDARAYFEAARVAFESGEITREAVIGNLPDSANSDDPLQLKRLYAALVERAADPNAIGGLVSIVRDRWARRVIKDVGRYAADNAQLHMLDPYSLSGEVMAQIDRISASRSENMTGSLYQSMALLAQSIEHPDTLRGPTTGLMTLDNLVNGYKAGQLYVIAGRPGMGKSAFMCSSLRRTAMAGHGVAIVSLEMTREEIAARVASDAFGSISGPFFGSILKGLMGEYDRQKLNDIFASAHDVPMHVDASARLTFTEIASRSRKAKAEFEARGQRLAVVCIDHMGLVTPSDRYRGNKVAEAGEVSAQARALAKELNCCVILLCQLSREVEKREDKRPVMSDLRWSGEIEQDAHVIGFLYREEYYLAMDPDADANDRMAAKNKLELLLRKNRNGATADLQLWCSIGHSSIRDL